jgi:hypothetical protein
MPYDLGAGGPVAIAQLARDVFPGLGQKYQDRLEPAEPDSLLLGHVYSTGRKYSTPTQYFSALTTTRNRTDTGSNELQIGGRNLTGN